MTPIFIYDLLIRGINVSDFHIVVSFNDYYTLIVAFLTKQIQNRYRYRHLPDSPMNDSTEHNSTRRYSWGIQRLVSTRSNCNFSFFLFGGGGVFMGSQN